MNTVNLIRTPLPEFKDFEYRSWAEIFEDFRGDDSPHEIRRVVDEIVRSGSRSIIDLNLGAGYRLSSVLAELDRRSWKMAEVKGMDTDPQHVSATKAALKAGGHDAELKVMKWSEIPYSSWAQSVDFGLLLGNCLTHRWHGSVSLTEATIRDDLQAIRKVFGHGGRLFVDRRNFELIGSMSAYTPQERMRRFSRMQSVCYHGLGDRRLAFPAYVSDELVVYHYYDLDQRVWSANDFFPVMHEAMLAAFQGLFTIDAVLCDYEVRKAQAGQFIQYLVKTYDESEELCG